MTRIVMTKEKVLVKTKGSLENIDGNEEEEVKQVAGKKRTKSTITIPKAVTKSFKIQSNEKTSNDLKTPEDEALFAERIFELVKQKFAAESKHVVETKQDEDKQLQITAEFAIQKRLDEKFASIPSIVSNIFNTQFKSFISNKTDIQNIITNSSSAIPSSIDFVDNLTELIPVSLSKLSKEFQSLRHACSTHAKAAALRRNSSNEPIVLDIYKDKRDMDTYDILSNLKESLCRGRKNRNVSTSRSLSTTEKDYAFLKRKVKHLSDTRSFDESFSEERISMIDVFRAKFLSIIRPLWNSEQILQYFSVEATVQNTLLNDKPNAHGFMTEAIGNAIHSMIGFSDFETYKVILADGSCVTKTFVLPTKEDYQKLIKVCIDNHFHSKRTKSHRKLNKEDNGTSLKSKHSTTSSTSKTNSSEYGTNVSIGSTEEDVPSSISRSAEPDRTQKRSNEISMADLLAED